MPPCREFGGVRPDIRAALDVVERDKSRYLVSIALGKRSADEESPATKLAAQLKASEAELQTISETVTALAEQAAELERSLSSARSQRDDRWIEALNAAPEVKRLFESYASARQSVVDIEAKISALPFGTKAKDFRNTVDGLWFAHTYVARDDADAAWKAACAALRQNAGAELPSE